MTIKLFLLVLLVSCTYTLEGISELSDSNFEQQVSNDNSIWLVMFSADWVNHA